MSCLIACAEALWAADFPSQLLHSYRCFVQLFCDWLDFKLDYSLLQLSLISLLQRYPHSSKSPTYHQYRNAYRATFATIASNSQSPSGNMLAILS